MLVQQTMPLFQVFTMDISKHLHAYEVEYHVLQDEMLNTPLRSDTDVVDKLEAANQALKRQNLELLEKLQAAHSQCRNADAQLGSLTTANDKLRSHVRALELERLALLGAVRRLQQGTSGPGVQLTPISCSTSPIHNIAVDRFLEDNSHITLKSNSLTELNHEVEELMAQRRRASGDERGAGGDGELRVHQAHRPRSSNY